MRGRAILGLAVAVVLAFGSHASARVEVDSEVSKQHAIEIALKVLKPSRGAVVFALPKPIGAKQRVGEAFTGRLRPAGRSAWLFWADLDAYAYFAHPSRLLLVDEQTGRVIRDERMLWWPIVGRGPPAFLRSRSAYNGAKFRVFSGVSPRRVAKRQPAALSGPRVARDIPAGAFKDDCLVSIGPNDDPAFSGSIEAWMGWAREGGFKSYRVEAGADGFRGEGNPTGSDVRATIEKAAKEKCKDVVLRITGHGTPPPRSRDDPFGDGDSFDGDYSKLKNLNDLPFVSSVPKKPDEALEPDRGAGITSRQLRDIVREFAEQSITFKVVVESCFSGRFANDLEKNKPPNLLVVITSSSASDVSYGPLSPEVDVRDTAYFNHTFSKDGRLQQRTVTLDVPERWSPRTTSETTGGLLQAFDAFARSDAQVKEAQANAAKTGYPLMAFVLRDMWSTSSRWDILTGVTRPRILFRPPVEVSSKVDVRTHDLGEQFASAWQFVWTDDGTRDGVLAFTDRTGGKLGLFDPANGNTQAISLNVTNPNGIGVINPMTFALAGVGGVEIFDRSGSGKRTTLQMTDTQLVGLAVGPQNRSLYVTDLRNNQLITIRPPYAAATDVTKTPLPTSCVRPTGIVPGTAGLTVLCQQTNNVAFLDLGGGLVRTLALPSPNVGAQEARPTGRGGIVFSGFGANRVYRLNGNQLLNAPTGRGPAVPTVVYYPDDYEDLFAPQTTDDYAFVPQFTVGGATVAEFDAKKGDGEQLTILAGRNLVGSAVGPGCSPWVADGTPGKRALHQVRFSVPGAPTRQRAVGKNQVDHPTGCSDFSDAAKTHTLSVRIPSRWSQAKSLQLGLVGYRGDPWGARSTFGANFPIQLTAKTAGGAATKPRITLKQTGAYTAVVTITRIPAKAKTVNLTITSRGSNSPFGILSAARVRR